MSKKTSTTTATPDAPDPPEDLVEAIRNGQWMPMVGAGLSKQAKNGEQLFPSWNELMTGLIEDLVKAKRLDAQDEEFLRYALREYGPARVADTFRSPRMNGLPAHYSDSDWRTMLRKKFPANIEPGECHLELCRLAHHGILTTNFDQLIEDAWRSLSGGARGPKSSSPTVVIDAVDVEWALKLRSRFVFKMHGCISNPDSIVLTQTQYNKLELNEGYKAMVDAIFLTRTILFVGFSFSDREFTELLKRHKDTLRGLSLPHYALLPSPEMVSNKQAQIHELEKLGVKAIFYDPAGNHASITKFFKNLRTATRDRDTKKQP